MLSRRMNCGAVIEARRHEKGEGEEQMAEKIMRLRGRSARELPKPQSPFHPHKHWIFYMLDDYRSQCES